MSSLGRTATMLRVEVASDITACDAAAKIQTEIWSPELTVPAGLMLAAVHSGGFLALGYVDNDARPAGFVFGFLGMHDGRLLHHSHQLAVREQYRHSGLAIRLKQAQRAHCLSQGIDMIVWTMDPLEARNARLNFARLGAFARTYHRDFYGHMPDKINAGIPSDRLLVEWPITSDRVDQRLRGSEALSRLEDAERRGVRYLLVAEGDKPGAAIPAADDTHLVQVPADIHSLKRRDRKLALEWRTAVGATLEPAFEAGYVALELLRTSDGARAAYLVTRQPEGATGTRAGSTSR